VNQRASVSALALFLVVGPVYAGNLCKANSFTRSQAVQGKREFDSSCGLCHQYNLMGRVPGNYRNETPDIRILDTHYTQTIDENGGVVPPLIGEKFFRKWKDQKALQARISTAIGGFPPKNYVKVESDQRIAAYILYENCEELTRASHQPHGAPSGSRAHS
jgi:hypothetical protein